MLEKIKRRLVSLVASCLIEAESQINCPACAEQTPAPQASGIRRTLLYLSPPVLADLYRYLKKMIRG